MIWYFTSSLLDHLKPVSYAFQTFLHTMIMVYYCISGVSCSYDSSASQLLELGMSEFCSTVPNSHVKSRVCFRVLLNCNVEFNQPSYWLYSVPNLLVFQHLVTLYLGGFVVRVMSEIECCSRVCKKTETRGLFSRVARSFKPPDAAHMPEGEQSC